MGFLRILSLSFMSVGLLGLVAAYAFFQWKYRYWRNRNIRTTRPCFPLGDVSGIVFSKHIGVIFKDIYDQFKGERYNGMWVIHRPFIMLRDPDLIRSVFVRDFNHFRDRGLYVNERVDPLSGNLFFVNGPRWRNLRTKLSPNFTSTKMRRMFAMMADKGEALREELREAAEESREVQPKEYTVGYTHEVVAACILGVRADTIRNRRCLFRRMGRMAFAASWFAIIRAGFSFLVPDLAGLLRIVATPKPVADFFVRTVRDVMEFREANPDDRPGDFMQILSELKNRGYLDEADHNGNEKPDPRKLCRFTFTNAVAQAFIFWIGGFESPATTMQFALYEMSMNQAIQDRARREVKSVLAKYNGEMTYEGILEMEYLGRVVDETLRKYPPVTILNRVCTQRYKIPDSDLVLEEGTPVLVPVLGIHMDPEYFPDPERFDPDRFLEEQKSTRPHYTYLPFGEGPHACIGQRFAQMQMRVGLANLLSSYKFETTDKTPEKPIFHRKLIIYTVKHGIPLRITRLDE